MATVRIETPLTEEKARALKSGDSVLLSGTVYTARDAAHKRIVEAMERLIQNAEDLMKIVDDVNQRITNLAASTEEMAASTTIIEQVTAELRNKFETIQAL